MHLTLCLCGDLPALSVRSRLCLVMHRDETRKTTNSGRLAARCLAGSELLVHGRKGERAEAPAGGFRDLLLFPGPEAEPLGAQHLEGPPVRLVVPDGTWRQAAKMTRRLPWMASLPQVTVADEGRTRYRLRAERRVGGLSTLEAIARAFGILEGPEIQQQLETVFRKMVERTLFSRGTLTREQVFGGVPDGVMMHAPDSGTGRGGW